MNLQEQVKTVVSAQADRMCQEITNFKAGTDYERLTQTEKEQLQTYCDALMDIKLNYDGSSELFWPKNSCKIFYTFK